MPGGLRKWGSSIRQFWLEQTLNLEASRASTDAGTGVASDNKDEEFTDP